MKKQIKKLSLNKRTISNLNSSEMNSVLGATNYSYAAACCGGGGGYHTKKCTQNQNTCPGHKAC
jgi:natural product precursor